MSLCGHAWARATVSQVELNGRSVGTDELVALAFVLNRTVSDLLDPRGLDGRNSHGLDVGVMTVPGAEAAAWISGNQRD